MAKDLPHVTSATTEPAAAYRYCVRRLMEEDYVRREGRFSPENWRIDRISAFGVDLLSARNLHRKDVFADVLSFGADCWLIASHGMDLYRREAAYVDSEDMDVLTLVLEGGYALGPRGDAPRRMSAGKAMYLRAGAHNLVERTYDLPRPVTSVVLAGTSKGFRRATATMGLREDHIGSAASPGATHGREWRAPPSFRDFALSALRLGGSGSARCVRYRAVAAELLSLLPAKNHATSPGPSDADASTRQRERVAIEALRRRVESNPHVPLSLDEAARISGMSRSKLTRVFRAETGVSLGEFQRELRLWRAAHALERGEVNVTQAAELAGFAEVSSFTRAFRRRFGRPPNLALPRRR